ncbi:carbonic anhydrase 2-like isoform X1 [Argonauta hians]
MSPTIYMTMCLAFIGATAASGEWSYEDVPDWKKDNPNCAYSSQSPIDIKTDKALYKKLGAFNWNNYQVSEKSKLTNNGHTVKLSINGPMLSGGGLNGTYKAAQLHFHWAEGMLNKGSEHGVNGKYYPLEMHIVHFKSTYPNIAPALNDKSGLAVLGFFFQISEEENDNLKPIFDVVENLSTDKTINNFNLKKLVADSNVDDFYRYNGSLTTPPCSEAVVWTVFAQPKRISQTQLKKLWTVKDSHGKTQKNYRPVLSLNDRVVLTSSKNTSSAGMPKTFSALVILSVFITYLCRLEF